jgi:predicted regulator of Ras-like GTPase activity (Roadblock/LC7/MglB family)
MISSDALTGLRDVDDVQGSFLVGGEGSLLARDLPAVFHAELFAEVGPRLVRLREMFDPGSQQPSTVTLRFSEHKLHVRSIGQMLLCVLTGAKVNAPALRMAINLVARRVQGEAGAQIGNALFDAITPMPTTRLTPPPPAGSSTATPVPGGPDSRRDILYRGRRPG